MCGHLCLLLFQVLNCYQYTSASDTWSYGILLYEIFSHGLPPYPGMNNMVKADMLVQ